MPVLKVNDQRYSLRPGANRLGAGADVDVPLDGDTSPGVHAIVEVVNDEQVVIRATEGSAAIRLNGVTLGEPTPLVHGDKLEVAGRELHYSDESKAGATERMSSEAMAALAADAAAPSRATASTGGRLVSLVDGKEYAIPPRGLVIGRDASCGVVVPHTEVSRKHAEIAPSERGYTLRDFSANGVQVNGQPIAAMRVLARADVIRIGPEDFRFYADVVPTQPRSRSPIASKPATKAAPRAVQPQVQRPVIRNSAAADTHRQTSSPPRQEGSPWVRSVVLLALGAAAAFFLLKR